MMMMMTMKKEERQGKLYSRIQLRRFSILTGFPRSTLPPTPAILSLPFAFVTSVQRRESAAPRPRRVTNLRVFGLSALVPAIARQRSRATLDPPCKNTRVNKLAARVVALATRQSALCGPRPQRARKRADPTGFGGLLARVTSRGWSGFARLHLVQTHADIFHPLSFTLDSAGYSWTSPASSALVLSLNNVFWI